jgi:hypothetical protein
MAHRYFQHTDDRDRYKRNYQQKSEVKAKRAESRNEKIKEQIRQDQLAVTQGATYRSGIGVEDNNSDEQESGRSKNRSKNNNVCKFCGLSGHMRRSSRFCLQNKKRLEQEQEAAKETAEGEAATEMELDEDGVVATAASESGGSVGATGKCIPCAKCFWARCSSKIFILIFHYVYMH